MSKRRHKHEEHEEHVNHERWLVSYADMMTVLMALFIVLFAISKVDPVKAAQVKEAYTEGKSATNLVLAGDQGINQVDNGAQVIDLRAMAGGNPMEQMTASSVAQKALDKAQTDAAQHDLNAAKSEVNQYRQIEKQLNQALVAKGDQNQVTYRITSDGLVIGLVADNVFFANASADIQPKGLEVLDTAGPILAMLPNAIAVQGHTNSLPLKNTSRYRDNWDLSSARANSVLTRFIAVNGISDQRLSSTGYGSARPLYPDSDARALAGNRRVDLVIGSASSEAVKALLPQVAAGTPSDGPAEISTGATPISNPQPGTAVVVTAALTTPRN